VPMFRAGRDPYDVAQPDFQNHAITLLEGRRPQ
jgi:hypothetical protein